MKVKAIQTLQRWATSVLSPSVDELRWRLDALQSKVNVLHQAADQHRRRIQDLMTAELFSRWKETPHVLYSRAEFGYWLNFLGLCGQGAEIGVYRGEYSELLLQTWSGQRLYSIDPWVQFDREEYVDVCNLSERDQEKNVRSSAERLGVFGTRSAILRQTSEQAATQFAAGSLDFVYIDAQHHYEAVCRDLALWADKVRPGGIVGGHDYLDGDIDSGVYGVKRAVDEWCRARDLTPSVTREGPYPSWFVIAPE